MKVLLFMLAIAMAPLSFADSNSSYLVKLKPGVNPVSFGIKNNVSLKLIVPQLNLYKAQPLSGAGGAQALSALNKNEKVEFAQNNHKVTLRDQTKDDAVVVEPAVTTLPGQPNDKDFVQQWSLLKDDTTFGIDALSAWSTYGTGGKDVNGNEIVIAIVDGGFDINHVDLINNKWVNPGEIAGNDIDDDGNGFVDDINGWDFEEQTGNIPVDYHGTHVAGILGAQGNNSLNGAGVNWNIKIMYISMGWSLGDTADTMSAYGYALAQKELWIKSGGKQGANVVAINSSFGIDKADCNSDQYKVWNEMFDKLGEVGILSIGATANAGWDIDSVGDVPTACSSEFMVAVTNSTITGAKDSFAGFGKATIDLAAPGTDIFSTFPNNDFGSLSGTSMATPHVTGAVGYLYSVASASFINQATANPKQGALIVKDVLLKTVSPRDSMKDKMVSGGILNLNTASEMISTL